MTRCARAVMVAALLANVAGACLSVAHGRPWMLLLNVAGFVAVAALWRRSEQRIGRVRASTKLILDSIDATPPRGVTVLRADGTEQPVELVYRGRQPDGQHLWQVAGMVLQRGDRIHAEMIPGHTGIEFEQKGWADDI